MEYEVDRVVDKQRGCSVEVGDCGMKYTIQVCGQTSTIFFEPDGFLGRWFVEAKKRR